MSSSRLGRGTVLFAVLTVLAVNGCECGGGGIGDPCDTNGDCDPGLACDPLTGTCYEGDVDGGGTTTDGGGATTTDSGGGTTSDSGGATSTDSGGGTTSDSGGTTTTDSGGPPPLSVTGDACAFDAECSGTGSGAGMAFCIPSLFGFPGGYCSVNGCDPMIAGDCPGADAFCLPDPAGGAGDANCVDGCTGPADCRPGYNCFDIAVFTGGTGGPFACLPLCTGDMDCDTAAGEQCDLASFTCVTPGSDIGNACVDNSECPAGSFCLGEAVLGFPGGYCLAECDPTGPGGGTCPGTGECQGTDPMDPAAGTCFAPCTTGGPGGGTCARPGYACGDTLPFGGMLAGDACLPACVDDTVCTLPTYTCEVVFGFCQPPLTNFGGPCDDPSECVGGFCLTEADAGAPFGNCQDECDPTMSIPGDCPAGGVCIDLSGFAGGTLGLCYVGCDPASPVCRVGYDCDTFPFTTDDVCLPDCGASSECQSGCCEATILGGTCVDPGGMCL